MADVDGVGSSVSVADAKEAGLTAPVFSVGLTRALPPVRFFISISLLRRQQSHLGSSHAAQSCVDENWQQ